VEELAKFKSISCQKDLTTTTEINDPSTTISIAFTMSTNLEKSGLKHWTLNVSGFELSSGQGGS
jgi:hypothetical protein